MPYIFLKSFSFESLFHGLAVVFDRTDVIIDHVEQFLVDFNGEILFRFVVAHYYAGGGILDGWSLADDDFHLVKILFQIF